MDRLATIVRAARLITLVVALTVVVGSAWAMRPAEVVAGKASQARAAVHELAPAKSRVLVVLPTYADMASAFRVGSLPPCLLPKGFTVVMWNGTPEIAPVSPIPNWRGWEDTRGACVWVIGESPTP
jgi:hypothetical protein